MPVTKSKFTINEQILKKKQLPTENASEFQEKTLNELAGVALFKPQNIWNIWCNLQQQKYYYQKLFPNIKQTHRDSVGKNKLKVMAILVCQ